MSPIFLFYPIQSNVGINSGAPFRARGGDTLENLVTHRAEKIWLSRDCPYDVHWCTTCSVCARVFQGPAFVYITTFGLKMDPKKRNTKQCSRVKRITKICQVKNIWGIFLSFDGQKTCITVRFYLRSEHRSPIECRFRKAGSLFVLYTTQV